MLDGSWFPSYLWAEPTGRQACLMLGAAILGIVVSFWFLSWARTSCSDELFDLEQALLPLHRFPFSPQGEVEVYGEGVRIMRSGTCVSPMFSSVWETSDRGTPSDRVLSVRWFGPDGPVTTDIRIGPVDRSSLEKLKDIMEHYGKG